MAPGFEPGAYKANYHDTGFVSAPLLLTPMTSTSTRVPLFIGGQKLPSSSNEYFEVRNPYSGKVVSEAWSASAQDCKYAVEAAGKAVSAWEKMGPGAKRDIFLKAAELVESDKYREKIKKAVVDETGVTEKWGEMVNVTVSANYLRNAAGWVYQVRGETLPSDFGAVAIVQRRAMGVILVMSPANAPVGLGFIGICSPLAAGNAIVSKSSEVCPASQAIVAEILYEAGLPAGVISLISVRKEDTPARTAEMIAHPLVRKINFTGSDRVGRILAIEAAKYLKPCILELGGKAPAIVLNDADIQAAARAIIFGGMINSGQVCIGTERVIVQRSVSESLISALSAIASKIKAGNPYTDPDAKLGCVLTAAGAEGIVGMLKDAVAQGAHVIVGDVKCEGAVVQPHLVKDVKPGMMLWERETFGPVLVIAVVDTVDEAIELANASNYSLTSALWTSDTRLALEIAPQIHAGKVIVNGPTAYSEPAFSMAGLGGSSGYGRFDIDSYTDKRLIMLVPPNQKYMLVDDL